MSGLKEVLDVVEESRVFRRRESESEKRICSGTCTQCCLMMYGLQAVVWVSGQEARGTLRRQPSVLVRGIRWSAGRAGCLWIDEEFYDWLEVESRME